MITTHNDSGSLAGVEPLPEGFNQRELLEVFGLRKKFNARLYAAQARLIEESFAEFVQTWTRLPEEIRTQAEQDYRRSYEEVIRLSGEAMKKNAQR